MYAVAGARQQPRVRELRAPLLLREPHPRRLAARVDVVAPGFQRGLGNNCAVVDAGADGVAHDLGALEQRRERVDVVVDLDDLVVGRADARHVSENLFDLLAVTPCGDERDVVLPQELDDQPGGEAARAVDDDGALVAHVAS